LMLLLSYVGGDHLSPRILCHTSAFASRRRAGAFFHNSGKQGAAGGPQVPRGVLGALRTPGACGRAAGALEVLAVIRNTLKRQGLDCPVVEVGCMGHCYAEPIVTISKPGYPPIAYGHVNPVIAERLVREFVVGNNPSPEFALGALEANEIIPSFADFPRARYEKKVLLANCGLIDPEQIEHYITRGGYQALETALKTPPEEIVDRIKKSGLRGRGGGGFPTGRKLEICRSTPGSPKYVICNAD
jgi:NADH-quinone oxidoreductase subunit F